LTDFCSIQTLPAALFLVLAGCPTAEPADDDDATAQDDDDDTSHDDDDTSHDDPVLHPAGGWDCDDHDPAVTPGNGC
jgi:hypothetical protein